MFVSNNQHLQASMFSSVNALPEKLQERLEDSWAGDFYHEFFVRLDEKAFAVLYSSKFSRPNTPVNVLVGLEVLKAGFGWSDAEMYDNFCYNMQVRRALGYYDLSSGHFELRTMYNFRRRVTKHMQEKGENLLEQAFEQITDEQIVAFELKTNKLRMDSTMIASNIRAMTRLQLLVEVLQRTYRMLNEEDQQRYEKEFAPYRKGSSGQYIYHLKGEDTPEHLRRIGELMRRLVDALRPRYSKEHAYRTLRRVFQEHFVVAESTLRPKEGQELSASSMQSPDDWEATYRQKRGESHKGYVTNATETCDPENPFQLIVQVQTEPNNTDDAALLVAALPQLKERTAVEELHTDGGYNSAEVDRVMREHKVQQIQTAIRGRKPAAEKLGLDDFEWQIESADWSAQAVTCPHGQRVAVTAGRTAEHYRAAFDASICENCPLRGQCPTRPLKRSAQNVLRFSQQDLDLALRRQRTADERGSQQHLRPAVEATVRAIKHPFGNGKVPVRGQRRVSMMMLGAAAMNNVRQINRYLSSLRKARKAEKTNQNATGSAQRPPVRAFLASFWAKLWAHLRLTPLPQPVWACSS